MKIKKLLYDWHMRSDGECSGEDCHTAEIGKMHYDEKKIVKDIIEKSACGEGDKWFYDIIFEDDSMIRTFNPNRVYFEKAT